MGYLDYSGRDEPAGVQTAAAASTASTAGGTTTTTAGITPAFGPQSAGPINLSGLVCNVRRTTGQEPYPLVGATTTVLGDKLYVFGGRILSRSRPQLTSDLYELDLIRRHWTKVEATGDIPPPRYFHSVCALGDSKLVCYGGMSPAPTTASASSTARDSSASQSSSGQDMTQQPEVVVMSDIHVFDVPSRTWTRVPANDSPQGRYAHCATILPSSACFTSATAPLSAIHHNPASANPHQGSIGVDIDGSGGAEMVIVGGQDSSNHYIEQVSVFNLRSLKWTMTSPLGRSCGAYRSVIAPLTGMRVSDIGADSAAAQKPAAAEAVGDADGCPMLIYSNYNFLDVKLELQLRMPDGQLIEKRMRSQASPPGLRFPNGGIINGHFVVSGTYLTSSRQEYALWALDLKTLTWGRIDAGGSVFGHGSWNRGVLWSRRNTFVVLGHRKRSLVEDYNHRRINFSHVCLVELEAFGLYDNPCRTAPTSAYVSYSCPAVPASLQAKLAQLTSGGRPLSTASDELGKLALSMPEMADMELQAVGGERIPVNSRILIRRWGPYFIQLLRESCDSGVSDSATLRGGPPAAAAAGAGPGMMYLSRNSSVTITPSIGQNSNFSGSTGTTLVGSTAGGGAGAGSALSKSLLSNLEIPSAHALPPTSRQRVLYLPHTYLTLQVLVYYFYASSLPPPGSSLCTPQILCSLLQIARPYQIDGLLEATVERLHRVLDGRNAAAVFNAAAMAAGGGRGTGFVSGPGGTLEALNGANSISSSSASSFNRNINRDAAMAAASSNSNSSILASDSSDTEHGGNDSSAISGARTSNSSSNSMGRTGRVARTTRAFSSATGATTTTTASSGSGSGNSSRGIPLRINTSNLPGGSGGVTAATATATTATTTTTTRPTHALSRNQSFDQDDSLSNSSAPTSSASATSANFSHSDSEHGNGSRQRSSDGRRRRDTDAELRPHREIWTGDPSCVIGLQKRGLRGLMEGRRLRERTGKPSGTGAGIGAAPSTATATAGPGLGLGVATTTAASSGDVVVAAGVDRSNEASSMANAI